MFAELPRWLTEIPVLGRRHTSPVRQFVGLGLTAFGLTPGRKNDTMGLGMAWSFLNRDPNAGAFFFPDVKRQGRALDNNDLTFQAYYQMNVRKGVYFQPTMSFIPNPGERQNIPDALAITLRLTILFNAASFRMFTRAPWPDPEGNRLASSTTRSTLSWRLRR